MAAGLALSLAGPEVYGKTFTWRTAPADFNWSNKNNWDSNPYPQSFTDDAAFGSSSKTTVVLDVNDVTLNSLSFTSADNYTFSHASNLLGLYGGGLVQGGSGTVQIGVGVSMYGSQTWGGAGTGTVTVDGAVSGATFSLAKSGAWRLVLNAANTFDGGFILSEGEVEFGNDGANGTGTLQLNGGTILAGGGSRVLDEGVVVGGNFGVGGANDLTLSGGMDLGTTTRTITVSNAGATTFSGILSGSAGLTKAGSGTLTLAGAGGNTYTGTTLVNEGILALGKSSGDAVSGSLVIGDGIGTDVVQLTSGNQIGDSSVVSIQSGGVLDLDGNADTVGGLNMTGGSVTTGSGTLRLNGDVTGNASASSASISGNLALGSSTRTFTVADGAAATDMSLSAVVSGTGGLTKEGAGTLALSGANSSLSGGVTLNGGTTVASGYQSLGTGGLAIHNGAELQAKFQSGLNNATVSGITIGDGTIRRTAAGGLASGFMSDSAGSTMTVNGAASLIDAGGDSSSGYLKMNGAVTVNDGGTLTLNALTVNDEVQLAGTQDVTIKGGGTLATTGDGIKTIGTGASGRTIIGEGNSASEATFAIGGGTGYTSGTDVQVNGSGTGGLRVEGVSTDVSSFLDAARVGGVTGSGGTLTIAYTDSAFAAIDLDPVGTSSVKLGFDTANGSAPLYALGSVDNDLSNWEGLVIKGGTVALRQNQKFTGDQTGAGSSMHMEGGVLQLFGGGSQRTLEFTGDLHLTGGSIDGGYSGATKGILKTSGNVSSDGTAILRNPNLTVAPSGGTTSIGGSTALSGLGELKKTGGGTTTIDVEVGATQIVINQGTLLLGGDNKIGDSTPLILSGGAFATGGFDDALGTMSMTANSTVDLGSGDSIIRFDNSAGVLWTGGTELVICNWSGLVDGGGTDQIYFGSDLSGLTSGQLLQVVFKDPLGLSPGNYAARILPTGEVVPIPEPRVVAVLSLLGGLICWREGRRWWRKGRP